MRYSLAAFLLLTGLLLACLGQAEPINVRTLAQEGFSAKFNPENPNKPGIMIEIFRAIERIDPGVRFVGYEVRGATARVEEDLATGAIDVFFGLAKTTPRASKYHYVEPPLYATSSVLVARSADSVRVLSWDDVRALGEKGVILVARGTSHAQYLRAQGGLQIDEQAATTPANLRKLLSGRGRFFFASDVNAIEEIKLMGLESRLKVLPARFWETGIYAVFSRQADPEVVKRISADIRKLERSGELMKIRARYFVD